MKKLTIRKFGPVDDVEIELKRVNVILGPQSSGKSTILKVACYCEWLERQIVLSYDPDKYCETQFFVNNLVRFHKLEGYMHPDSYIRYESEYVAFEYVAKIKKCNFSWKNREKYLVYKRPKIAYIPSERNLVAAIPNWYQISMSNNNIVDFMKEWEFARKSFDKNEKILGTSFSYRYNPSNKSDRIVMENGTEVDLTNASSGLQSMTPLYIMLRYLTGDFFKEMHVKVEDTIIREHLKNIIASVVPDLTFEKQMEILHGIMTPHHTDLYIEEPEAHIFPSTQKEFIYSLVNMLNGTKKHSCFLATHSPYIMTALNNLIMAGELMTESKEKMEVIKERFPKRQTLRYKEVAAFAMEEGKIKSIMDDDFKLISADAIDDASIEISDDFNFLLNL